MVARVVSTSPCGAGQLLYATVLTQYLDAGIPVYGLPFRIHVGDPLPTTVYEMAERLVRMIRIAQPCGPYYLAGWSFGGTLAYEIATQLITKGDTVGFLGLLDTEYAAGASTVSEWPTDVRHRLLCELERWDLEGETTSDNDIRLNIAELKRQVSRMNFATLLQTCRDQGLLPSPLTELSDQEIEYYLAIEHSFHLADIRYRTEPIPIPIHLFSAQDPEPVDRLRGWGAILPQHLIHVIPIYGTHISMLRSPHLRGLGRILSHLIRMTIRNELSSP